ncbi:TetR family transcriptional regulator [Rhodovulum sulfidophilum]|uniref:TetR family transcriptional regulator n=1 Tax=Rhodovulum sulfidophilum TaxID=35806 RepID=A0A0D6AYI5_RHOSU|nr:TetR family transcriptional regulator [Rhodovulum sulfidophilum]
MRNADATRQRILEAARAEFSRFGLAGARVNRIAADSGANKERIYANFGSKEGLFEAVMADRLSQHARGVGAWEGTPDEIIDRLRDRHTESPDLLRLMLWEALEVGDALVPDEARRRAHYQERLAALAAAFELPSKAEAGAAMMLLIGLGAWARTMPQLARMLAPEDDVEAFETAMDGLLHKLARVALDNGG